MGDFYGENGDKGKAAENYKKALTIKGSADTRNKLNPLFIK